MITSNSWPTSIARRSIVGHLLLVLASLLVGLVTIELAAQFYVARIAKQGKLFAPDAELGWVPLPNLDLERRNADGELWHVVTDDDGIRGPSDWPADGRIRMLVLGDSFAFGEGVDLEDRFDSLLQQRFGALSIVNLGVMGHGPEQQLIRSRTWRSRLRAGDLLLLLTYGNDFLDLASTTHSGRSKPWVEMREEELIAHPPEIGPIEFLRDRSYLFSVVARSFNVDLSGQFEARLRQSGQLYREVLLRAVRPLIERGVLVVLVHHGDRVFELPFAAADVFAATCPAFSGCLALDPTIARHGREEIFLNDGHWAVGGHRLAAEEIASHLLSLDGLGPRLERDRDRNIAGQRR